MPEDAKDLPFPFTTRDMLLFGRKASFGLSITTSQAVNGTIVIAGATRSGEFTFEMGITAAAQNTTQTFALPDLPLWITVGDASSTLHPNTIYAEAYLTVNGVRVHLLTAGYVTGFGSITWPAIYKEKTDIGIGMPFRTSVSNPAAGANFSQQYTDQAFRIIDGISFRLVTSATAATRTVQVYSDIGSSGAHWSVSAVTQTASLTRNYYFQKTSNDGATSVSTRVIQPIAHDWFLAEEDTINSLIDSMQSGDQLSLIQIWGRKWHTRTTPGS